MPDFITSLFERRLVRVIAYFFVLLVIGLITLNITFPGERLKQIAIVQAEKALNKNKQPGKDILWDVEIMDVDLWWVLGFEFHNVTLKERWTQEQKDRAEKESKDGPPQQPLSISVARVAARVAPITSLMNLGLGVRFDVNFGLGDDPGGAIEGVAVIKSSTQELDIDFNQVDLYRSGMLQSATGIPGFGSLDGKVLLTLNKKGRPIAGSMDLKGSKITIGPADVKLDRIFSMGYLQVPQTNFGNLTLKANIASPSPRSEPRFTFETFEMVGRDIRMEVWGHTILAQRARNRTLDMKLRMQLDASFVKEHNLKSFLSFGQLMAGKGKDNWYGLKIAGATSKPKVTGSREAASGKTPQEEAKAAASGADAKKAVKAVKPAKKK